MNDTLKSIKERYACRSFSSMGPTDEEIWAVANAAIQSPSSMNKQRWQIIIVRDEHLINEIEMDAMDAIEKMDDRTAYKTIQARGGHLFYQAPCVVFVAIDSLDPIGSALDAGIVCQSITIAAQSLGLATCICSLSGQAFEGDRKDYFKRLLKFPQGYEFGMSILLGRSDSHGEPHKPNPEKITIIES